ncbi:hypothetical protein ScPMuIL_013491 [Solemya velum]
MDEKHKMVLQVLRGFIVENLRFLMGIINILFLKEVLCEEEKNTILVEDVLQAQIERLLDILLWKGENAFPSFIEALKETGNEHIVKELEQQGEGASCSPTSGTQLRSLGAKPDEVEDEATPATTIVISPDGVMRGACNVIENVQTGGNIVAAPVKLNIYADQMMIGDGNILQTGDNKTSLLTDKTKAEMQFWEEKRKKADRERVARRRKERRYNPTSLQRTYKYDLLMAHDLGDTIDLINQETYQIEPNGM